MLSSTFSIHSHHPQANNNIIKRRNGESDGREKVGSPKIRERRIVSTPLLIMTMMVIFYYYYYNTVYFFWGYCFGSTECTGLCAAGALLYYSYSADDISLWLLAVLGRKRDVCPAKNKNKPVVGWGISFEWTWGTVIKGQEDSGQCSPVQW